MATALREVHAEVQTQIMTITPDEARRIMKLNSRNRPLSNARVDQFAAAMKRGDWSFNGDTIKISKTGVLLDGQHRLSAIIKSGVPVKAIVIDGLEDDVFDTIDQGKSRTSADVLKVRGEKNYAGLAAAARLLYAYERTGNPYNARAENQPTAREIERTVDHHPRLREIVNVHTGRYPWIKRYVTVSLAAMSRYVFSTFYPQDTDQFFVSLETGANLDEGSPILAVRDRFIEDRGSKEKIPARYKGALLFKAFKKYLNGDSVKQLRVRTTGKQPEKLTDIFSIRPDE